MEDFSKYNGDGTILRKAQFKMLDILLEVDAICKKHSIEYFLDGGSCLGAVRHKGFIPWDDDLDIAVMRKDFLKLRKILPKELSKDLVYQDETTEKNYYLKISKVRDKKSIIKEERDMNLKENGIFLDIIPMEPIFSFRLYNFINFFYGRAFRRLKNFSSSKTEYIIALFMWVPANMMVWCARFLAKITRSKKVCHVFGWNNYNYLYKENIYPIKTAEFEGHQICVPNDPDAFLRRLFGDYMQIPPADKRVVHATEIVFLED